MNKTAVALGTFDGLHKGHIKVLKCALESPLESVAVTFSLPPKAYFSKEIKNIISAAEKEQILKEMGFSRVVSLDFEKIKDMSPEDFLLMLKCELNCGSITCGYNYRFGKSGAGDAEYLEKFCCENNIELNIVSEVSENGETVSSTAVRGMLKSGDVEKANELCFKKFGFSAEIVHGDARGRTIGFPTVNQFYPDELTDLRFGVYKSEITVCGKTYNSITNIGIRPTFQTKRVSAETYIENFSADVYGQIADLRFVKFIRPEKKFSSIDELKKQIEIDVKK